MSVDVMGAVFKVALPPSEKVVALALADHAHDDGTEARPGIASLAVKTTLSTRQVQRVIKILVAKGVLAVQRPATNTQPVCYRFVLDRHGNLVFGGDILSPGDTERGSGVTPVADGGDASVTQTVSEPSAEPSTLMSIDGVAPSAFEIRFAEVWAIYPRKRGKADAAKAVQARIRAGVTWAELLTATRNYAAARKGQDETYTVWPKRFYGPDYWRDYLPGGAGMTEGPATKSKAEIEIDVAEAVAFVVDLINSSSADVTGPVENVLADLLFRRFSRQQVGRMSVPDIRGHIATFAFGPRRKETA